MSPTHPPIPENSALLNTISAILPPPPSGEERRRHRRFKVERPGKLFRRNTQQFAAVRSCDLSFSGARLEVDSARPFSVGELVDLGLSMSKSAVVPSTSLVNAIVVRAVALGDTRQAIAVRYINIAREHSAQPSRIHASTH